MFSFSCIFIIKIIFRIFAKVEEICLLPYELLDTRVRAKNAVFTALQKVRNVPRHVANSAGLIRFFVDYTYHFMRHATYEYCSSFFR
jgi:hypothetical protein